MKGKVKPMTSLDLYTKLKDKILKDYPSANISLVSITKNNKEYKGLKVSFDRSYIDPVFNLDELVVNTYSEKDVEKFANHISNEIKLATAYSPIDANILDSYEKIRNYLCVDVIQQRENKDFLDTVPCKYFGSDMAIIVKAVLTESPETSDRLPMITITNEMLDIFNVNKDVLIRDAMENSGKLNPPEILMPSDFLYGEGYIESPETHLQDNAKIPLRILTTQTGICKASVLLNQDIMSDLANRYDGSFYLVPSTIGCLAVPDNYINSKEFIQNLEKILTEKGQMVNAQAIGEIYHYSHETKTLETEHSYEEQKNRIVNEPKKDIKISTEKPKTEKDKELEI